MIEKDGTVECKVDSKDSSLPVHVQSSLWINVLGGILTILTTLLAETLCLLTLI